MGTIRPSDPLSTEWVTVFFVVVIAALAWINAISPRKWRLISETIFRLRLGRQTIREEFDLQDRTLIALLVSASAVMGLFGYQLSVTFADLEAGWWRAIEGMGLVLGVTVAQILVIRAGAFLFQGDGGAQEYIYTIVLLLIGLGLFLLPIDLLASYHPAWRPALLGLGALALVLMVLFRWLRALAIGLGSGTRPGYILLYICALELLPVALAFRSLQQVLPPDVRPH